jgi:hypothetical protein
MNGSAAVDEKVEPASPPDGSGPHRPVSHGLLQRLSLASIVAVVGGVALLNTSNDPAAVVAWWLVYAVATGLTLASSANDNVRTVAGLATLPAAIPIIEAGFLTIVLHFPVRISGVVPTARIGISIAFVNWIGIWLFSYARKPVLYAIRKGAKPETREKLEHLEKAVRAGAILIATVAMAVAGVGYFRP